MGMIFKSILRNTGLIRCNHSTMNTRLPIRWLVILLCCCGSFAKAQTQALTKAEMTALGDVVDDSKTVDEAGFYLLIRHMAEHNRSRAGAQIPDYPQLLEHPDDYRGKLFYIEGKLEDVKPVQLTPHKHTKNVQVWKIRVPDETDPTKNYLLWVYLVDPPKTKTVEKNMALPTTGQKVKVKLPAERGREVKLVARYYKTLKLTSLITGKSDRYMTFVANTATLAPAPPLKDNSNLIGQGVVIFVLFVGALAVFVFVLIWRKRDPRQSSLKQAIAQRRRERALMLDDDDFTDDDQQSDAPLPQDPEQALSMLRNAHIQPLTDTPTSNDSKNNDDSAQSPDHEQTHPPATDAAESTDKE